MKSPHESFLCPPDLVAEIIATAYAKSLRAKLHNTTNVSVEPKKPTVGIVGAGLMGVAIAAAHLRCAIPVVLFDNQPESVKTAPSRITAELAIQHEKTDCIDNLLKLSKNISEIVQTDIIIETIPEKLKTKQKLYRQLSECLWPEKTHIPLLFSNTSTISIGQLVPPNSGITEPGRFCGFHFFHPVRERSLLEIIPGPQTSQATIDAAIRHAVLIEKLPVIVKDTPGFLVNRLLHPYLNEALVMLEEGVSIERIEEVSGRFGMAMGPFRIMDEIGLDVTLHSGWILSKAFPERVHESRILLKLIEQRRLGRKTGNGFFVYPDSVSWAKPGNPNPKLADFLEELKKGRNNDLDYSGITDEMIARRLFISILDEAGRILDEKVVSDPETVDAAMLYALGFPENRGGLCYWAKATGIGNREWGNRE